MTKTEPSHVRFTNKAKDDIKQITRQLRRDQGAKYASVIVADIRASCYKLADFPFRYPLYDEFYPELRRARYQSWLIYYSVGNQIDIMRITHDRQQIGAEDFDG